VHFFDKINNNIIVIALKNCSVNVIININKLWQTITQCKQHE